MSEVRIVISGDASGARQAAAEAGAAVQKFGQAGQISAGQTAAAFRQLPAQLTDVATQLAGGANPLLVLLQQGGQVKDSFGGIGPAARALASVMSPVGLAVAGVAAAVGGLSLAAYQGRQESKDLANALALTGNRAGITEGQFNGLVNSLAAARNAAAGNVRELLQTLVASGEQTATTLEASGRAAMALAKLNGKSAAENALAFAGMGDNVAAWAAKANKAYAYLTAEQFKQIQSLGAQGDASAAVKLNMEALAAALESRTAPALGLIDQALDGAAKKWDNFWNAVKGVGRAETLDDRIAALQKKIDEMDPWTRKGGYGGNTDFKDISAELEGALKERGLMAMRASDKAAAQAEENNRILEASRAYQDTVLAIQSAGNANLLANNLANLDQRRAITEKAYAAFVIDGGAYADRIIAIERAKLAEETALAQKAVDIERTRVVTTKAERNSRDAAELAAQARLAALRGKGYQLEAQVQAGAFAAKPREVADSPRGEFRRAEITAEGTAGNNALDLYTASRRSAAQQQAQDLVAINRGLGIELIKDDRDRGLAQIANEAQALERRLDLLALNAEQRQAVEASLADWITLRNRKLDEDLKPGWQKQLDAWRDNNRLMRDSYASMMDGVLKNAEDAWVQLSTTGKLNVRSLVNGILQEMARVQFKQFAASLGGGGGGGGGGFLGSFISVIGKLMGAPGTYAPTGGTGDFARFDRLSGGRAGGGSVNAGGLYKVGERGPELLRMGSQAGSVIPSNIAAQALGGGAAPVQVNYAPVLNIDSRTDQAQVVQLVSGALGQNNRELMALLRAKRVL